MEKFWDYFFGLFIQVTFQHGSKVCILPSSNVDYLQDEVTSNSGQVLNIGPLSRRGQFHFYNMTVDSSTSRSPL